MVMPAQAALEEKSAGARRGGSRGYDGSYDEGHLVSEACGEDKPDFPQREAAKIHHGERRSPLSRPEETVGPGPAERPGRERERERGLQSASASPWRNQGRKEMLVSTFDLQRSFIPSANNQLLGAACKTGRSLHCCCRPQLVWRASTA